MKNIVFILSIVTATTAITAAEPTPLIQRTSGRGENGLWIHYIAAHQTHTEIATYFPDKQNYCASFIAHGSPFKIAPVATPSSSSSNSASSSSPLHAIRAAAKKSAIELLGWETLTKKTGEELDSFTGTFAIAQNFGYTTEESRRRYLHLHSHYILQEARKCLPPTSPTLQSFNEVGSSSSSSSSSTSSLSSSPH